MQELSNSTAKVGGRKVQAPGRRCFHWAVNRKEDGLLFYCV